jgi:hypothetical protein
MTFTLKMAIAVCGEILDRLQPTTWLKPELHSFIFDTGCRNLRSRIHMY